MYHFGVLLSHYQPIVNYTAVKDSGIEFVNVKSSEGDHFTDPLYNKHVTEARKLGLGVIAFHYWRPKGSIGNLGRFLASTTDNPPDIYEIDWEVDGRGILATISELLGLASGIIDQTKTLPLIYTNPDFGNRYFKYIPTAMTRLPLHVASYNRGYPLQVKPWAGWDVWQTTKNSRIGGIPGSACIEVTHTNFWNLVDKVGGKEYPND